MLRVGLAAALLLLLWASSGEAADYYANPTGSGTTCSAGSPCTVATGLTKLFPGDTLWLQDGTYTGASGVLTVYCPPGGALRNGTASAKIRVKAINGNLNSTAVTIDGQFARIGLQIYGCDYWVFEGFNVKQGAGHVIHVLDAKNNEFRQIVAWDAQIYGNSAVLSTDFSTRGANGNLFEDFAAFGTGGRIIGIGYGGVASGLPNVCRRCWARWEGSTGQVFVEAITLIYGGWRGGECENCLATHTGESMPENYYDTLYNITRQEPCPGAPVPDPNQTCSTCGLAWYDPISCPHFNTNYGRFYARPGAGAGLLDVGDGQQLNHSRIYGSMAYVQRGYGIGNLPDLVSVGDQDAQLSHVLASIPPNRSASGSDPGFQQQGTNVFENRTPYAGGTASHLTALGPLSAKWYTGVGNNTGGFGNSASLSPSGQFVVTDTVGAANKDALTAAQSPWNGANGAKLCHQWLNHAETQQPLWPWPMNDRIRQATATAGNAISNHVANGKDVCAVGNSQCSGVLGHTRTETNVTADIESILGTIPPECRSDQTIPPVVLGPIVEYFLDEAASGTPTSALDATANPVNLTAVVTGGQPTYIEPSSNHRGLEWVTRLGGGGVHAAVDGTKLKTAGLHGAQKFTLILTADLDNVTPTLVNDANTRVGIAARSNSTLAVIFNGVGVTWTGFNLPTAGRQNYHAVVDTTQAAPENRIRLYVGGVDQGNGSGSFPAQNATLDLQTGKRLSLGNYDLSATNNSAIDGRIFYAAICSQPMTALDIALDDVALDTNDDTAGGGGCVSGTPTPSSVIYVGEGGWVTSTATTPLTPGLPLALAPGDQSLAIVSSRPTGTVGPIWTFDPNWTKVSECFKPGGRSVALQLWKYAPVTGTLTTNPLTQAPSIAINDIGFGWQAEIIAYRNTPGPVEGVANDNPPTLTWIPGSVTTVNNNAKVLSIVATADNSELAVQTPNGFTTRLSGAVWDTNNGPLAIGVADITQGQAGVVVMPTWQQAANGPDEWCGITAALDLIDEPGGEEPPPQGGGPTPIPRLIVPSRPLTSTRPPITSRPVTP